MTSLRKNRVTVLILAVMFCLLQPFIGFADDVPVRFRVGKDFDKSLTEMTRLSSTAIPLQTQLTEFTRASGLAIHRDRRTNPRTPISLETDFETRIQVLFEISQTIPETSICAHDNVILLGPADRVHRIPVLMDIAKKTMLDISKRRKNAGSNVRARSFAPKWDLLAEPRLLIVEAAKNAGVEISNPDVIPHDVWAAGSLPSMNFAEFAAIILNEFDQTIVADSTVMAVKVQAIDKNQKSTLKYAIGGDSRKAAEADQKARFPKMAVRWTTSAAELSGSIDEHAQLHQLIESHRVSMKKSADIVSKNPPSLKKMSFQLKEGRSTAGQLIESLRRNKLQIEVRDEESPEVQAQLNQTVQIEAMAKPLPSAKFFDVLFGKLFQITIEDDRAILELKQDQ